MTQKKIFEFRRPLEKLVDDTVLVRMEAISRARSFLHFLAELDPEYLKELAAASPAYDVADILYYSVMESRWKKELSFPGHDLSLLLANLVHQATPPGELVLLEPSLLPTAILLAGAGWKILLPESGVEFAPGLEKNTAAKAWFRLGQPLASADVASVLSRILPGSGWSALSGPFDPAAVILGGNPGVTNGKIKDLTDLVAPIKNGWFLTSWDFLGVKTYDNMRRVWLDERNLAGVLQLPMFKRPSSGFYPAILRCSTDKGGTRLAQIDDVRPGEGNLNQKLGISLMLEEPDGKNSLDVAADEIKNEPLTNLTPAYWLNSVKKRSSGANFSDLGRLARILRCQLPRTRLETATPCGSAENGQFVVREVGVFDLMGNCGFLWPGSGGFVSLDLRAASDPMQYLLRQGDIIFTFRGTADSVGNAGFAAFEPEQPTIAGTAYYIIRPLPAINPVWLYWQLRLPETRGEVLAAMSGTSMLNISAADLRALPIRLPREEELKNLLAMQEALAVQARAMVDMNRLVASQTIKILDFARG